MKSPTVKLNDGRHIPQLGMGVYQIPNETLPDVIAAGVELGYRLIDGAFFYDNEQGMGEGVRKADAPREDLFVTSKVWTRDHGFDQARRAIEISLKNTGLDYLDLMLIHWPCPNKNLYVETWKALIAAREDGQVKSIGVSNFNPDHLDRIIDETGVAPVLNQIELHPRMQQTTMRAENKKRGVLTQSWTPLGGGAAFDSPIIQTIAARTGKTPAQIVLRWHMQIGASAIPRSARETRLAENIDVFDFDLTASEMDTISALDTATRLGPNPLDFEGF